MKTADHKDLKETRVSGEVIFDGRLLHVRRDTVRLPNGKHTTREYIVHPGAATVVAILDSGELLLERQFRYAPGVELVELPGGKIDPGESSLATARRELLEETGYEAVSWTQLTTIIPVCAYATERIEIWLAQGLRHIGRKLDDGEFLETFPLTVDEAVAWVRDGRIIDAKTIIGVLWADRVRRGIWPGPPTPYHPPTAGR